MDLEPVIVLSLAVLAHGWRANIYGPPALLNALGWAINLLAVLALIAVTAFGS